MYFVIVLLACCKGQQPYEKETSSSYWEKLGKDHIVKRITRKELKNGIAKNAILFIGDGMGIATVTAGRIHAGQSRSKKGKIVDGESFNLAIDNFPIVGLAKTYSVDHQTTDSAASATAYLCGSKARSGTLGVDGRCVRGRCLTCGPETYVESILKRAHRKGKWTGIVTNTRITHASPAGAYANCPDRKWEGFDGIRFNKTHASQGCTDIAQQLVVNASFINVAFGGGLAQFLPINNKSNHGSGIRVDNVDLVEKWLSIQRARHGRRGYKFVSNLADFNKLRPPLSNVLGLFAPSHMAFGDEEKSQPTLASMTQKAIEILSQSPKGFVLFVEGGLIDRAHHRAQAARALDEFVRFDAAIERALEFVNIKNTLFVISADHSHVFSIGTEVYRNSDVLGLARSRNRNVSDVDQKPFTIISYGNGPGYVKTRTRFDEQYWKQWKEDKEENAAMLRYAAAVPMNYETHAGEDVPVYADGPGSEILSGTYEQSTIAQVISYSACLSPYDNEERCQKN